MNVHTRDWSAFVTTGPQGAAHIELAVEGVHCAACMARIEKGLGRLEGVENARLNLTTHRLAVDWLPDRTNAGVVVDKLESMGFKAHPFDPGTVRGRDDAVSRELLRALAVAGFGGMNIMLLSVSVWSGNVTDITPETRDLFHWISALIALPVVAYSGRPFFASAWSALRSRNVNMDVPISIGVVLAVFMSLLQTIQHAHHAYFDSAVMLLFFLLIGRFLDQNMRRRTRSFAENLAALRAETARLIRPDGTTVDVPLSQVEPGAQVLISAGERVSVDGVIEQGVSEIDQSLVTGETRLADVGPGDVVHAGTLNAAGALTVRVTAAAKGTLLDEVTRLLETASQAKSRYIRLADRAAQLYAPFVHTAAAVTFLGWLLAGIGWQPSLVIAISVLIITCPCALGLAIPAVQVVSSGLLFNKGILLNSGDALERFATVDTIVFDKTGTLTLPDATLANQDQVSDVDLALAGRLALASRHPLATAIARASGAKEPVAGAREAAGSGVVASVEGADCKLGSPRFCGVEESVVEEALTGHPDASIIAFRHGEAAPVLFVVRQAIRPDAVEVIAQLKKRGLRIEILSGDREAAVAMVAKDLAVDDYTAGLDPRGKIARLQALKEAGNTVLMVGDGLNDAPALAAAHVSMSPVSAVHLSQAAADAVFLGESLMAVPAALNTSRRAHAAMRQNLMLASVYNLIAVPIAVAGFVTPLLAALAMSASSIVVTLNALRLRFGAAE
ncbi:heavy metal translocating P-type ATPase [Breoghania sp.]|uniref:heavy metal translocating P-type ATPase n=1 Tax=Breoghania sp. TaxID=2065378 RepID=UPI0029CA8A95|nr:heavy metal translocating P-type ATPase [Breoghania sp.]